RAVPRRLDRPDELVDGDPGCGAHSRLLGREVDGRLDAVELVQLLLDARRAGSAGHALEIEADLSGLQRTGHALDYTTWGYLAQAASAAGSGAPCGAIA